MSTERPHSDLEPWQWPEAHWRKLVERVRAGKALRPAEWPGGARCAVALSFDSDHETSDLREGGQSIGRLAWGQMGARVGVPRILKLLDKYQVKASFYVPAVTGLQPSAMAAWSSAMTGSSPHPATTIPYSVTGA